MARRRKKNHQEKHIYSKKEIVFSSGWITENFRLADRQREILRDAKKATNIENLSTLFELIEVENIVSFAHLVRFVHLNRPELRQLLKENSTYLRYFIDSRRFDLSCGFVDLPYNKVCEMLKHSELHVQELDEKLKHYIQTLGQNRDEIKKLELENAHLKQSISENQDFVKYLLEKNKDLKEMLDSEILITLDS